MCVCVCGPSSQIPIATSGIRAMGYLMRHQLRAEGGSAVPQRIITHFVKVRLPSYNDMFLCKASHPALKPPTSLVDEMSTVN